MSSAKEFQLSTPLILNTPEHVSLPRRLAYRAVTLLFWMGWIYLWIPLITLLGWLGGIALFREQIMVQQGWQSFLDNLPAYGLVVVMMSGALLSWALTNWFRFANREARKGVSHVSIKQQAEQLRVNENDLALWQKQKRLVIHHDEHSQILRVTK
jgi:biofilm PGA synthesis protein PgaD